MKQCFKCGTTKDMDEFYEHPMMADGHLGKCKECTRRDVKERAQNNPDIMRKYEALRATRPERKRNQRRYALAHVARYPQKRKARVIVGNAIRDGRLIRKPCEVCGLEKSEAHHADYSKPLEVRWLCLIHHREADNKERKWQSN
jgi:hypothetical protein